MERRTIDFNTLLFDGAVGYGACRRPRELADGTRLCRLTEDGRWMVPLVRRVHHSRMEPLVSALVGWLVQRWGDLAAAGVARAALGDSQQRAFRKVVSAAIKRVKTLGGERQEFLERVLIEHRERLEAVRHLPDLAGTVH